jgi:hypothetical protein
MPQKYNKAPSLGRGGGGAGGGGGASTDKYSTRPAAAAIQVYRPSLGRWATVAKAITLPGLGRLLAVPFRHRQRLKGRVSLPLVAAQWALEWGAALLLVRFDAERRCLEIPLPDVRRLGLLEPFDGQAELWLNLDLFQEREWVEWPFISGPIVRLGPGPDELPRQLTFVGEGVA